MCTLQVLIRYCTLSKAFCKWPKRTLLSSFPSLNSTVSEGAAVKIAIPCIILLSSFSQAELPSLDQYVEWCRSDNALLLQEVLKQESDSSLQDWLASPFFDYRAAYDENTGKVIRLKKGTPLHVSAEHGCKQMAKVLISLGTNVMVKGVNDYTPMHSAASAGSVKIMSLLLHHGSGLDPRTPFPGSITPLVLAAEGNHLKAVAYLLRRGAFPDSGNGITALHHAVQHDNEEMVALLLEYNASTDIPDYMGHLPLFHAKGIKVKQMLAQEQ